MATIKDVAALAGISYTTVSHVVNKTRPVSEPVRLKVEAAIKQLDYVPSAVARSLKAKTTATIGLLVPNSLNPYFAELARGIEDYCERNGYCVILCNSDDNPDKQRNYLRVLLEKRVDGLVVASAGGDLGMASGLVGVRTPMVIVDRSLEGVEADLVCIDHELGAYLATRHLLELGHRAIACIGGPAITRVAHWARLQHREGGERQTGFGAERCQVQILPDAGRPLCTIAPLELVQPRRRQGHTALNAHLGIRRRGHGRQLGAVLEIARYPSALHQHHPSAPARKLQWREHKKPRASLHLPVVQIHRVFGQPAPLQHHSTVYKGLLRLGRRASRVCQRTPVYGRLAGPRIQYRLQRLFLGGSRQLPTSQRGGDQHAHHSSQGNEPKTQARRTAKGGHRIMRSMKYLVVLAFIAILASLASALFFMMRNGRDDKSKGNHMAKALAVRVGLSIVLFLCILVAWQLGYIQPTGLPATR